MDSKDRRLQNGFTLIERPIVAGVVAVLGTVTLPAYQDQIHKGATHGWTKRPARHRTRSAVG